ncbi:MAG: amino acid ABC transporter substrate-binding protein [Clostridia bacterium]|jgi:polar amino acid transport system substrate-binding protein|nr:amino acid ABC transporter substrate-binding protein [Clostridia bacterium]
MKKVLSVILAAVMIAACVLLASCGKTEEKVLNVYTNAGFAPYEYLDDKGNVVGVDIDVVNYIGEKLGYKVVVNDIEFNAILNEVAKDKFAVGAAGMSKKAERDEVALASDVYATSVQYIIAPKGTFAGDQVALADAVAYVAGSDIKSIGVQKGTTGADLVAESIENTAAKAIEYSNAIIASQDIGTTVAAVVIDKMPAEAICKDKDTLQCWSLDAEMESYVMYFNKDNADLVKQVNEVLKKMIEDGLIDQYTVKHSS